MSKRLALSLLAAIFAVAPAFASGGGGGGGGGGGFGAGAPSDAAPAYDPVVEYRNGVRFMEAKDYAKAEAAFKRVISVSKQEANAHFLLGMAHIAQDEWKPASKALKTAVKYQPAMFEAHARLVLVSRKLADAKTEQTHLAALEAAKSDCAGTCPNARAIEAAFALLETPADAQQQSALPPAFRAASAQFGDGAYLEAVRLINLGQYDAAKQSLEQARLAFGPHPDVLTYLGFANRKQGNYTQAVNFYRAALTIAPNHVGANEYLGEYFVETGDMPAAEAQLRKLQKICRFGCAETAELQRWIDAARS